MSEPTVDLNYSYWEMYLRECAALEVKPSVSDYSVWLSDLEMDRKEDYEVSDGYER